MSAYLAAHGVEDAQGIIEYAYAVTTKYGEASAALAAEMYDATAALASVHVPPAVPAETATYQEVADSIKRASSYQNPKTISREAARLVKQAGADTTVQNAARDGAEWAWVPNGDTCAFCLTLASRGWQPASKKALKGNHAQHIHANCDCAYAIRFDSESELRGYDPEKYQEIYYGAEGKNSTARINYIRRQNYKANRDEINAQKRAAYAERKAREAGKKSSQQLGAKNVTEEYTKAAKPGTGSITYDDGYQKGSHEAEIRTAQWLRENLGGDITLLTESNADRVRTPDYLWDGKLWDLKTISSEKAANSAVRHGLSQIAQNPGGIILDIGDTPFDEKTLWNVIDKRMGWYKNEGNIDIMLLSERKLLAVKRY
nr:MAG TPA: minor capsid protein 2 [Caudoviricetes sp.]